MHTYTASRLTTNNRLFPLTVQIHEIGVTIREPGLFSAKEITIPFARIASVDIHCPFVGFSSITISTTGEGGIEAKGFTAGEVKEMKRIILERI